MLWAALAVTVLTFPWPQPPGSDPSLARITVHVVAAVVAIAAVAHESKSAWLAWVFASVAYDAALIVPYARWVRDASDVWALGIPVLVVVALAVNLAAGVVLAIVRRPVARLRP